MTDYSVYHIVMAVLALLGFMAEDDFDLDDPGCVYNDGGRRFYVFHLILRDDYSIPEDRFTELLELFTGYCEIKPHLFHVEYYDAAYIPRYPRNFSSVYVTVYLDAEEVC